MREAAVGNALSPTVYSLVGGTIIADVDDDLKSALNSCRLYTSKFVTEICCVYYI